MRAAIGIEKEEKGRERMAALMRVRRGRVRVLMLVSGVGRVRMAMPMSGGKMRAGAVLMRGSGRERRRQRVQQRGRPLAMEGEATRAGRVRTVVMMRGERRMAAAPVEQGSGLGESRMMRTGGIECAVRRERKRVELRDSAWVTERMAMVLKQHSRQAWQHLDGTRSWG